MELEQLGWIGFFKEHFRPFDDQGYNVGRVYLENRLFFIAFFPTPRNFTIINLESLADRFHKQKRP